MGCLDRRQTFIFENLHQKTTQKMLKFPSLVLGVLLIILQQNEICAIIDSANLDVNFYWRQFNSTIPSDALKAGTDVNGSPTYIGTALFLPHGNLPGNIFVNDKFVYSFAALSELKTDVNVKILCAPPNATQPAWTKINIDELEAASLNCVFVEGGNELGVTLYIGRVSIKGQYVIGKVFPKSLIYGGLDVWSKSERSPYRGLKDFEILSVCKNVTVTVS